MVEVAIRMYQLDTGKLPRSLDDLLDANVPARRGPYVLKAKLIDATGRRIEYTAESNRSAFRLAMSQPYSGLVRYCPGLSCYTGQ